MEIIRPKLELPENVIAFTTTRRGGISKSPYESLNLGAHVGDSFESVQHNRGLVHRKMNLPSEPVWLNQTHSTNIIELGPDVSNLTKNQFDGAVTSQRNVVCAIMTADCLPLMLFNKVGQRVGAIHVGWRGLADGIVEQAISRFGGDPSNIVAWAGPHISVAHFEIGYEVREQLGGPDSAFPESKNPDRCMANLSELCRLRLLAAGVANFVDSGHCTYAGTGQFFSHRRDSGGGRIASFIYLC